MSTMVKCPKKKCNSHNLSGVEAQDGLRKNNILNFLVGDAMAIFWQVDIINKEL